MPALLPVDHIYYTLMSGCEKPRERRENMRTLMAAALVAVLAGCAPRDPVAYAQMVCGDPDERLLPGSDEHAACVQFVAENPPSVLLAIGGGMLDPVTAAPHEFRSDSDRSVGGRTPRSRLRSG
jgi:hypothetical protein